MKDAYAAALLARYEGIPKVCQACCRALYGVFYRGLGGKIVCVRCRV